jgi:thiol:disulfide interchange protein DsbA
MLTRNVLHTLFGALLATQAWAFDEGVEYVALDQPQPTETGDKIEVVEVFMYSCPHCYHLEPTIESWLKTKPDNVEFRHMPAVFGPRVEPHARAFYAAELLGVRDKFHEPLFKALHVQKRKIWDEDALVAFAEEQGIDGKEFRDAYNSFFVNMKVRRAVEMGQRFGVDGVPAVVINGKYRTSPSQTGSKETLVKVMDHLIGVESGKVVAEEAKAPPAPASGS